MSRPNRHNRVVQMKQEMCQQEEIIQRKKREILEKQQQKLVQGEEAGSSGALFKNTYNNDGSFLENFKKLTQQQPPSTTTTDDHQDSEVQPAADNSCTTTVIDDDEQQDIDPDKPPNTVQELVERVVGSAGDGGDTVIEERLRTRKNLPRQLWFLFDLNSSEYKAYRSQVEAARSLLNIKSPGGLIEEAAGTSGNAAAARPNSATAAAADYGQFVTLHRGTVYRDEEDTEDSDTEYRREAKERNLKNMKNRLVCHYEDSDSSSSSSQMEQPKYEGSRFNQDNFPSHANQQDQAGAMNDSSPSASNNKRKRKSRWDSEAAATTSTAAASGASPPPPPGKKTKVDRTNPEVIKLAVNSFGSVDLDEEQWGKVEQQFQIKQVYHEMLAKRQELDRLAKNGRFKYEYDSDEDLDGGTWEHKLRKAEMDSTKTWTDTSTSVHNGRHHIGDFLPPDELKKFLDQHDKKKTKEDEPVTDYQDKKLTEDNKGFQMLQKLGWKDGEGLGASGSGIVNPINKSAPRESSNQGLGVSSACSPEEEDNEYDAYRKRMMLAYRFRPNPMNNPRRAYY